MVPSPETNAQLEFEGSEPLLKDFRFFWVLAIQ